MTHSVCIHVAQVLLVLSALNWGLVGLWGLDLVSLFFGVGTSSSTVLYLLAGGAAIYYTVDKVWVPVTKYVTSFLHAA